MAKLKSDRVISCISKDGKIRAAAIDNTITSQTAKSKHDLAIIPAFLLSKQLAAASLMACFLKGEERIILEAEGDGPVSYIYAEAIQVGEVRGFVDYDTEFDYNTISEFSQILGKGFYKVRKSLYNKSEPVTGVVNLYNGTIDDDLASYFSQSEQIPSAVILDVIIDDLGNITKSAGILIQAMPGITAQELLKLQDHLSNINFRDIIISSENSEDILKNTLPFDFDITKNDRVDFFCRCSKSKFMDKLVTLNLSELTDMKDKNENELVCHYCNSHYYLEPPDFDLLIEKVQARLN